ncbi:MAG TPA: TonB-dependent siderophore receptor [Vicinamibacterales bacterium]
MSSRHSSRLSRIPFWRTARVVSLIAIVALTLSVGAARVAGQEAASQAGSTKPNTTYRFDIPAGALDTALAAFEAATGLKLRQPPFSDLHRLTSPGVSGVLTAPDALARLLTGTGLTFRSVAPDAVELTVAVAPEAVDVTGKFIPYRPTASAGATKTETPLRDIPQTVNVVPESLLIDQHAQSVGDAMRNVPGVSVAQGEGNRDQVVVRGISSSSDFFVNGIRDDQERFRDLYNVARVEVVQGPAAVLFGRGGGGGIVNLVTRGPDRGAPSDVGLEFGAYDHKRATAQVGRAFGDSGSFRVSAMGEDSGGFRDAYFLDRYGVNPVAGFSVGGATTMMVGYEHLRDHRLADRGIPSQSGRPVDVPVSQFFGSPDQNDARSGVDSGTFTIEHRFGNRLTLRNTLLTGRYDKSYQNVYPGSAVNASGTLTLAAYNHEIDRTNTFNQTDLIYTARLGGMSHTLLGGMELGGQMQDEIRHTATPIPNVPVGDAIRDANFADAPLVVDRHAESTVVAGYVQDQVALTGHWKALVGARLDRFGVSVDDHLPGGSDLSRTDTKLSPRAGLIYQPTGNASIYGSYSYTFLPSGQTLGLTPTTAEVGPESASNYELGVKLDAVNGHLGIAAAVFRLDRNDVKNADPNDPIRLVLTGQQRTRGAMITLTGNLTPQWHVYGGYATLDAEVTSDTTAAPAGRTVGLVPRNQFTLWSTYDVTSRLGAGAGIVSQSKMYTSFTNAVELPAFTRADAVVYYRFGRYRLGVNAENLFDATYYPTANGDNNISPGAPRNVQVSLRAMF